MALVCRGRGLGARGDGGALTRRTWLDALAHELAARGVAAAEAAAIVVEAEAHLVEASAAPLEVFGPPAVYADEVTAALGTVRAPARAGAVRVRARDVSKRFRGRAAFAGVGLEVREGEALLLIGANGAGKSTLLRVLAGVLRPDTGEVDVRGTIGYAPQQGGLFDHLLPTEHFVLFGRPRGLSRRSAIAEGRRLAEQLGWDALSAPIVGSLSGGTRQKLTIALAALGSPDVLLLDEPYQGLDRESVERFWELLWSWRDEGRAALVASHAHDAVERADGVVELAS